MFTWKTAIIILYGAGLLVLQSAGRAEAVSALDIYVAAESPAEEDNPEQGAPSAPVIREHALSEVRLREAARQIAAEYNIPPRLYEAIIEFESGFRFARGASGEYGLAQVMPETGRMLAASGQVKSNWWCDPLENLRAGAVHLNNLKASLTRTEVNYARRKKYNLWALLLAQYNGGKGGVDKAVRNDERLPYKLEWYIYNVFKRYNKIG